MLGRCQLILRFLDSQTNGKLPENLVRISELNPTEQVYATLPTFLGAESHSQLIGKATCCNQRSNLIGYAFLVRIKMQVWPDYRKSNAYHYSYVSLFFISKNPRG